jgi:uncharacterized protein with GYD domain
MPKFLFEASYSAEGVRGLAQQGGSARRQTIEQLFTSLGGQLEGFYFAFGKTDVYVFGELPDNETAAAVAIAVNADGRTSVRTVVLLTAEQIDAASRASVGYVGPGN